MKNQSSSVSPKVIQILVINCAELTRLIEQEVAGLAIDDKFLI